MGEKYTGLREPPPLTLSSNPMFKKTCSGPRSVFEISAISGLLCLIESADLKRVTFHYMFHIRVIKGGFGEHEATWRGFGHSHSIHCTDIHNSESSFYFQTNMRVLHRKSKIPHFTLYGNFKVVLLPCSLLWDFVTFG